MSWDSVGNQFAVGECPVDIKYRQLEGTAVARLGHFDAALAEQCKSKALSPRKALGILRQRAASKRSARLVGQLYDSPAPCMVMVTRGDRSGRHYFGRLVLKCTCGAIRENLTYFLEHDAGTYQVVCPACSSGFYFCDRNGAFEPVGTPFQTEPPTQRTFAPIELTPVEQASGK